MRGSQAGASGVRRWAGGDFPLSLRQRYKNIIVERDIVAPLKICVHRVKVQQCLKNFQ